MNQLFKIKLKNYIEQVLHAPGNFTGNTLEMALVFDASLDKAYLENFTKELVNTLKQHSEVFKNVYLNTIYWRSDMELIKEVTPMPMLMLGKYFQEDSKKSVEVIKSIDELTRQLKLFYARSKLIIVISKGDFSIDNKEAVINNFSPFLGRKLIWLVKEMPNENVIEVLPKPSKVLKIEI